MTLAAALLGEFEVEAPVTRRFLERLPEDKLEWKPHERSMPRLVFLRSILLNHWYQHRGQFGVYLRLLGAKVPSSYGPSADELPDFLQGG